MNFALAFRISHFDMTKFVEHLDLLFALYLASECRNKSIFGEQEKHDRKCLLCTVHKRDCGQRLIDNYQSMNEQQKREILLMFYAANKLDRLGSIESDLKSTSEFFSALLCFGEHLNRQLHDLQLIRYGVDHWLKQQTFDVPPLDGSDELHWFIQFYCVGMTEMNVPDGLNYMLQTIGPKNRAHLRQALLRDNAEQPFVVWTHCSREPRTPHCPIDRIEQRSFLDASDGSTFRPDGLYCAKNDSWREWIALSETGTRHIDEWIESYKHRYVITNRSDLKLLVVDSFASYRSLANAYRDEVTYKWHFEGLHDNYDGVRVELFRIAEEVGYHNRRLKELDVDTLIVWNAACFEEIDMTEYDFRREMNDV